MSEAEQAQIRALELVIDAWKQEYEKTGRGSYFVFGWAGQRLQELLQRLKSECVAQVE